MKPVKGTVLNAISRHETPNWIYLQTGFMCRSHNKEPKRLWLNAVLQEISIVFSESYIPKCDG